MPIKTRTYPQAVRQRTRSRDTGRYSKLNPCEICGKSAGVEYFSHPLCNEMRGDGLVLCRRCCGKTEELDAAGYAAYVKAYRAKR